MAEVMTVTQTVQIGAEVTPGTSPGGGADKQLSALAVTIDPDFGTNQYAASGHRFDGVSVPNMEASKLKGDGPLTYTELPYVLSSLFGAATITTPVGATNARLWTWAPSLTGVITAITWLIQQGSSVQARAVNYATWTDATLDLTRKECKVSAAGFARQIQDGASLTASPTAIPLAPVLPEDWDIYLDQASAGIGTTQLLRCFHSTFGYTGAHGPVWPLDRSQASFAATVNQKPKLTCDLELAADSTLANVWSDARAANKNYIRLEAIGGEIESGQNYSLVIDVCAVPAPDAYQDDSGEYTQTWHFNVTEDPAWTAGSASGTAIIVALTTSLSAL